MHLKFEKKITYQDCFRCIIYILMIRLKRVDFYIKKKRNERKERKHDIIR